MKIAVRYFTRGGNTKKLAEAIGAAVGVEALSVSAPLEEDVDVLFLGSSVYGFDVDDEVKKFVAGIRVRVGKVVSFGTSALVKSTAKQMGKVLAGRSIPLAAEEFLCRGSFGPMHKGRPNADDLAAAARFARGIVG